jgi:hypothetical protein
MAEKHCKTLAAKQEFAAGRAFAARPPIGTPLAGHSLFGLAMNPALRLAAQRSAISPACARSAVEAMLPAVPGGGIHGPREMGMRPGVCVPELLRRWQ